jgi:hypothetical protein
MVSRYNEGKALDAVLRTIEAREGVVRSPDGWSPDETGIPDAAKRVDYVCTIGGALYALEHTGIEPFGEQIDLEVSNRRLFDPITERFNHRPDMELWELHVPVEASAGLTGRQLRRVREALSVWVDANARRFPVTRLYDRYANPHLGETVPDVPFPVSLHRGSLQGIDIPKDNPLVGGFAVKYSVGNSLEQSRALRLQKACEDKFPKLANWKKDGGARTILVLEENDIQLTNHHLVAHAFMIAEAAVSVEKPDEVFLVSTSIASDWWVSYLRRGGKTYYDDGERYHEVDPLGLVALTKR